jgi:hypothetical protein
MHYDARSTKHQETFPYQITPKGTVYRHRMTEASAKHPRSELLYVTAYTFTLSGGPLVTEGGAFKQDNTTDIVMCPTGNSEAYILIQGKIM